MKITQCTGPQGVKAPKDVLGWEVHLCKRDPMDFLSRSSTDETIEIKGSASSV